MVESILINLGRAQRRIFALGEKCGALSTGWVIMQTGET